MNAIKALSGLGRGRAARKTSARRCTAPWCAWLAVLALLACDVEHPPGPAPAACIDTACARLVTCSPMVASQFTHEDWRTLRGCRETFRCGSDHERCLEAVDALPCLHAGSTPEQNEEHARGVRRVQRACAVDRDEEPPGEGGGGVPTGGKW